MSFFINGGYIPIGDSPLFPATHIPEAVPHSIEVLKELLEKREEDIDLLFALANLSFYEHQPKEAIKCYKAALKIDKNSPEKRPEIHLNLAVVLYSESKRKEAETHFKKALELDENFEDALYYYAHMLSHENSYPEAQKLLLKLKKLSPENPRALSLLAYIHEETNEPKKADEYFKKVYELDPSITWVSHRLCKKEFLKGKVAFEESSYEKAFSIWSKAHKEYSDAFLRNREISSELKELQNKFIETKTIDKLVLEYKNAKDKKTFDKNFYHNLFSLYYFSIGMFPEFYLEEKEIKKDRKHWKSEIERMGSHPWAHYKIAVGLSYQGKIKKSIDLFEQSRDTLLPKKVQTLKIHEIISFIRKLTLPF